MEETKKMEKELEQKILKLIGEHGLLIEGMPILWKKLDETNELLKKNNDLVDRNNFLMAKTEEKISKFVEKKDKT